MIARPSSRSTAAPSTFIATSHTPVPTPLTKRPRATTGTEEEDGPGRGDDQAGGHQQRPGPYDGCRRPALNQPPLERAP